MKKIIALNLLLAFIFGISAWAHEGHHGHHVQLAGKYGGVLAEVHDKSHHLAYRAELVRAEDRTVRVYLYSAEHMELVPVNHFEKTVAAALIVKQAGEENKTAFTLTAEKKNFKGQAPKPSRKPFDIELTIKEKGKDLVVRFKNLD